MPQGGQQRGCPVSNRSRSVWARAFPSPTRPSCRSLSGLRPRLLPQDPPCPAGLVSSLLTLRGHSQLVPTPLAQRLTEDQQLPFKQPPQRGSQRPQLSWQVGEGWGKPLILPQKDGKWETSVRGAQPGRLSCLQSCPSPGAQHPSSASKRQYSTVVTD